MILLKYNSIKAKALFTRDKDYVVLNGEVLIVDEHTGRILMGRRYNEGIHQAIEAKEGVQVKAENQTLATVTLQNYFRLYTKLSGMTGTAETEAAEFMSTYKLGVVPIPTNRPMVRKDQPDLIYKNEESKFAQVVEDIAEPAVLDVKSLPARLPYALGLRYGSRGMRAARVRRDVRHGRIRQHQVVQLARQAADEVLRGARWRGGSMCVEKVPGRVGGVEPDRLEGGEAFHVFGRCRYAESVIAECGSREQKNNGIRPARGSGRIVM